MEREKDKSPTVGMAAELYKRGVGQGALKKGEFPRVRLASSVDMTKADPSCPVCKGRGVEKYIEDVVRRKGFRDRKRRIPVVCDCVRHGGGIKQDPLDAILEAAGKRRKDREDGFSFDGGYNTKTGTWSCPSCGEVVRTGTLEGVPILPVGWGRREGVIRCSHCCKGHTVEELSSGPLENGRLMFSQRHVLERLGLYHGSTALEVSSVSGIGESHVTEVLQFLFGEGCVEPCASRWTATKKGLCVLARFARNSAKDGKTGSEVGFPSFPAIVPGPYSRVDKEGNAYPEKYYKFRVTVNGGEDGSVSLDSIGPVPSYEKHCCDADSSTEGTGYLRLRGGISPERLAELGIKNGDEVMVGLTEDGTGNVVAALPHDVDGDTEEVFEEQPGEEENVHRPYSVIWNAVYMAIPESETDYRRAMDEALSRAKYRAPELINDSLAELSAVVGLFAHPVKNPPVAGSWQMEAVCALTGMSEEWVLEHSRVHVPSDAGGDDVR